MKNSEILELGTKELMERLEGEQELLLKLKQL